MKFLLDASALLNDPNFRFEEKNSYITTTQIMDEWKTIEVKFLAENALHKNILKIEEPEGGRVIRPRRTAPGAGLEELRL